MGQVLNYINAIQLSSLGSSQKNPRLMWPSTSWLSGQSLSFENLFLLQKSPHLLMQNLRSQVEQSAEACAMFFMHQDLVQAMALPLCITIS